MQSPTPTNEFKPGVRAGGEEVACQRKYVGGEDRYGRYSTTYRIESPQKVGRVFYPAGHAPAGSDTGLAYAARQLRQDTITATAKDDSPGTCDWDKDGRPNCSVSVNPSSIDLADTGWTEPGQYFGEDPKADIEDAIAHARSILKGDCESAINDLLRRVAIFLAVKGLEASGMKYEGEVKTLHEEYLKSLSAGQAVSAIETLVSNKNSHTIAYDDLRVDGNGHTSAEVKREGGRTTVTFFRGFFNTIWSGRSDIVSGVGPAVAPRPDVGPKISLFDRAISIIHEGIHAIDPQFSDENVGQVIKSAKKPVSREVGSKAITEFLKKKCR